MSFKGILSLKNGICNPASSYEYYQCVAGIFDSDDDNVWADTDFGVWMTPRSNVDWVLFCKDEVELTTATVPQAIVLN